MNNKKLNQHLVSLGMTPETESDREQIKQDKLDNKELRRVLKQMRDPNDHYYDNNPPQSWAEHTAYAIMYGE